MRVDEIINLIDPETKIAIRINERVEIKTAMDHICYYGGIEEIHCSEIEPNGYTDGDGISYLQLHCYDITEMKQEKDDLPFPNLKKTAEEMACKIFEYIQAKDLSD